MIKINDNSVFVGQIKQLLKEFNLPNAEIYKEDTQLIENKIYIKDNYLIRCRKDENNNLYLDDEHKENYIYNKSYVNITENLEVRNLLYDKYTHDYLGNYLRFLRDYKNLDLMSMYNCFNGEIINNFHVNKDLISTENSENDDTIKFDSKFNNIFKIDNNYIIYAVPVKFNKVYSIGLNCSTGCEAFLGIYNEELIHSNEIMIKLCNYSYQKYNSCILNKVNLYNTKTNREIVDEDKYQTLLNSYLDKIDNYLDEMENYSFPIESLFGYMWRLITSTKDLIYEEFIKIDWDKLDWDDPQQLSRLDNFLNNLKESESFKNKIKQESLITIDFKLLNAYEENLKLFIRIPFNNNSSLVVLEGDYTNCSQKVLKTNHLANISIPTMTEDNIINIQNYISDLELLSSNNSVGQYVLATRLVEYLTDNVISLLSEDYDIKKLQKVLIKRGAVHSDYLGIWSEADRTGLYGTILDEFQSTVIPYDSIGYLDKDIEQKLIFDFDKVENLEG